MYIDRYIDINMYIYIYIYMNIMTNMESNETCGEDPEDTVQAVEVCQLNFLPIESFELFLSSELLLI